GWGAAPAGVGGGAAGEGTAAGAGGGSHDSGEPGACERARPHHGVKEAGHQPPPWPPPSLPGRKPLQVRIAAWNAGDFGFRSPPGVAWTLIPTRPPEKSRSGETGRPGPALPAGH